jgi:hypothetical protein
MIMAVSNKTVLLSRIFVLEETAMELVNAAFAGHKHLFGDFNEPLQTIKSAIDNEWLAEVKFLGVKNGEFVHSFRLWIDWKVYEIHIADGDHEFQLNNDASVSEQIARVGTEVAKKMNSLVLEDRPTSIAVYYTYRSSTAREQANEELGTITISADNQKRLAEFLTSSSAVEVVSGRLPELHVELRARRKQIEPEL